MCDEQGKGKMTDRPRRVGLERSKILEAERSCLLWKEYLMKKHIHPKIANISILENLSTQCLTDLFRSRVLAIICL